MGLDHDTEGVDEVFIAFKWLSKSLLRQAEVAQGVPGSLRPRIS